MFSEQLKKWASLLKSTPLHPQWLLRFGTEENDLLIYARGRILDIGCADRWPERSLPPDCQYVAMDLQETGKLLYRSQPDVFADAAYLPFAKQSFDTVLLFEVLEHVSQPTQALQGIRRVLKTNGRVIITIPFLYPMHDEPYDFQRYTLYGLERELASAGLQVEIIKPILGTACSGGLLLSLAISGMVLRAIQGRRLVALLAPLILIIIPSINLCAWILDKILPSWPALTAGFFVVGTKP